MKIKDKTFELFIQEAKIQEAVKSIGQKINQDYAGLHPLFLPVLNGSFMFAADLMSRLTFRSSCLLSS